MRSLVVKRLRSSTSSLPQFRAHQRNAVSGPYVVEEQRGKVVSSSQSPGFSYGLKSALAGKGVIVKDKAFRNLNTSELQQKGAIISESLSGLPIYVRGNVLGGASELSRARFSKLLKQVTALLSSVSNIFVHDGAIGSAKSDAKVRVISDCPSAVLRLSSALWKTSARAISHDSWPLTVYVATSISPDVGDTIGLGAQASNNFMAADVERSSLVLCVKAFADINGTKEALAALSGPIISARGGLLLSGRLLLSNDSVVLLFAPEDTIPSCEDQLVSMDAGIILSTQGVAPLFRTRSHDSPTLFKVPAAIILACSDCSGTIPSLSKLSPSQAAYHFLAGYQNGIFFPAYLKGPSSIDALDLAQSLLSKLKDQQISSYLVNINEVRGKDFLKLVESALSRSVPLFEPKGGELQRKYKSFLFGVFKEIPEEFSF